MKLTEIAEGINKHLQRFAKDPEINKVDSYGCHEYFYPRAYAAGRFIYVSYVTYQGKRRLSKEKAESYLEALDKGFVGTQYQWERQNDEVGKGNPG